MEREGGRFCSRHRTLQVLKKALLVVEAIRDVVEDLDVVIQCGDERREISLSRRRNDLLDRPFDLFLC
jgi:hypothetical protein